MKAGVLDRGEMTAAYLDTGGMTTVPHDIYACWATAGLSDTWDGMTAASLDKGEITAVWLLQVG